MSWVWKMLHIAMAAVVVSTNEPQVIIIVHSELLTCLKRFCCGDNHGVHESVGELNELCSRLARVVYGSHQTAEQLCVIAIGRRCWVLHS
jgi:hypothetical protein